MDQNGLAAQILLLETRTGFTFPEALRQFFSRVGGAITGEIRPLKLSEAAFMLDNWPRYGFEPGYLPIAEARNGDLHCVRTHPPHHGHVYLLRWSGQDVDEFASVEQFIAAAFPLPPA